mmetsp:Transcript_11469/g.33813  ORF Transcript_11469/g.33813 Transcript_11469/m.33813 type:complete len:419 (+) Transcript_11469:1367-2623(+)
MGSTTGLIPSASDAASHTNSSIFIFSFPPYSPPELSRVSILFSTTATFFLYPLIAFSSSRSESGSGLSAEVTNSRRSAEGSRRKVREVWSMRTELVPGVSTSVKSERRGEREGGRRCIESPERRIIWTSSFGPVPVVTPSPSFSISAPRRRSPAKTVTSSVVGSAPLSNSLCPRSALMSVDFPALNSPAMTTRKVESITHSSLASLSRHSPPSLVEDCSSSNKAPPPAPKSGGISTPGIRSAIDRTRLTNELRSSRRVRCDSERRRRGTPTRSCDRCGKGGSGNAAGDDGGGRSIIRAPSSPLSPAADERYLLTPPQRLAILSEKETISRSRGETWPRPAAARGCCSPPRTTSGRTQHGRTAMLKGTRRNSRNPREAKDFVAAQVGRPVTADAALRCNQDEAPERMDERSMLVVAKLK